MEYLIRHACDVKDCPALTPLYMGKANYIIANMLMKTNSEDAASSSLSSLLCHTVTERVVRTNILGITVTIYSCACRGKKCILSSHAESFECKEDGMQKLTSQLVVFQRVTCIYSILTSQYMAWREAAIKNWTSLTSHWRFSSWFLK